MRPSASADNAGSRKVEPRKRKKSPASARRAAKRAMEQAEQHAEDQAILARKHVDHLGAGELNAAAVAAGDLKGMYAEHRNGKADAAERVVRSFDGIERTQLGRPTQTMREDNTRHRKSPQRKWRGE